MLGAAWSPKSNVLAGVDAEVGELYDEMSGEPFRELISEVDVLKARSSVGLKRGVQGACHACSDKLGEPVRRAGNELVVLRSMHPVRLKICEISYGVRCTFGLPVKDVMLQEGLIIPYTKRFPPLEFTLEKNIISDDFHVVGNEGMNLLFEIQWLHPLELRLGIGGMTSGDPQVATTKRMERINGRRLDLWATHGKITTTFSVLEQLYRDFQLSSHAHTLRRSLPRKVDVEFMNLSLGSEHDGLYLTAPSLTTQWEIGGTK
ncbi:hypothetical protein KI387_013338, partial [Taxus chinensis]